jgi:hypothetical protein
LQFSIKSVFLFVTGAAMGCLLSKRAAALYGNETPNQLIALLVGATAAWGLGYGALLGCPWRGLLIGSLSAAIALFGYELLMWTLVVIR